MQKAKYQIILLKNNERIETISSHDNVKRAILKYNNLLKENKKVTFPINFINHGKVTPVKYHLAIIKKKDYSSENIKLKNDYGQYVDQIVVDNDEWILYMKEEYFFEESFWVYGFNPSLERKDFNFIYNNFVYNRAKNKYDFINVYIYLNKLLFESVEHIDMVICKNKDDATRMYFMISEKSEHDKLKYIMFSGNANNTKSNAIKTINKIQKLTNWDRQKIKRYTT